VYVAAEGDLSFGDIFAADWFFDAYLRRDAAPLVEFQARGGNRAWRRAAPSPHRDLLLAHGQQRQAILLSDDCEAASIIRRGGRRQLVFAAIEPLPTAPTEARRALNTRAFRRFPLPPAERFSGGVVEFQEVFAVSVDGVLPEEGDDPRVLALAEETKLDLEVRWNAYSARRGPLAHLDNAEKLARLLTGRGQAERLGRLRAREEDPEERHIVAARALRAFRGTDDGVGDRRSRSR
jgi:hypothetical protein